MKAVVALATFTLTSRVGAVESTKKDWEEKTAGKSVSVKLLAHGEAIARASSPIGTS